MSYTKFSEDIYLLVPCKLQTVFIGNKQGANSSKEKERCSHVLVRMSSKLWYESEKKEGMIAPNLFSARKKEERGNACTVLARYDAESYPMTFVAVCASCDTRTLARNPLSTPSSSASGYHPPAGGILVCHNHNAARGLLLTAQPFPQIR